MKRRRRGSPSSRTLNLVRHVPGEAGAESPSEEATAAPARNVETIAHLEHAGLLRRSLTQRVADAISRSAGSTSSLVLHAVFFSGWIVLNTGVIPGLPAFDPYPFGLLTTIVSLEAIFLALFILISQNRMSRKAERREHLDLQINLLAEQESTVTLQLLRQLCEHAGVDLKAFDEETRDLEKGLEKRTNVRALIEALDQKLPSE